MDGVFSFLNCVFFFWLLSLCMQCYRNYICSYGMIGMKHFTCVAGKFAESVTQHIRTSGLQGIDIFAFLCMFYIWILYTSRIALCDWQFVSSKKKNVY